MAEIRVLDKHTAELIAAGEVVERPASVVKELTENAIDAGASSIAVEIRRGGIQLIEIRDDGCGIQPEYMHNAFVRHATSKISTEQDLEAIHTLGFRGEALASVASVARVSLLSKTPENETAWCYAIEGGQELSLQEAARPQGTTITVRDLFYNTPARMKFLKKDASEATFVQDAVEHLALSHPEISFRFIKEGKEQFFTPGDGKLISAAYALFPREYARELVSVEYEENGVRVSGLVTPPRAARASRSMQSFYVNGRFIKSRTLMAATENAYRGVLMGGRFPGCALMLEVPAQSVDVNVHPAKTEVRFARENDVFTTLYKAVKAAVLSPQSVENHLDLSAAQASKPVAQGVQVSFTTLEQDKPEFPSKTPGAAAAPGMQRSAVQALQSSPPQKVQPPLYSSLPENENSFSACYVGEQELIAPQASQVKAPETAETCAESPERAALFSARTAFARNSFASLDIAVEEPVSSGAASKMGWSEEKEAVLSTPPTETAQEDLVQALPDAEQTLQEKTEGSNLKNTFPEEAQPLVLIGEVFKTYILAQRGEELCIIDKHAAHERLIYEELSRSYGSVAGQLLLMPVSVELSAAEKTALLENQDYLENIGLSVDDFGGRTVLVREVPADIRVENVEDLIAEIAARLAAGQREPLSEKTAWVLHSIACRAAIKGGDTSHSPEMLRLAQDILDGNVPPFCPHGRPVILKITRKELEKQFGRLG